MAENTEDAKADQYTLETVPPLFLELDSLRPDFGTIKEFNPLNSECYKWLEKMRLIKYEEDYDEQAQRFNSAHVSPLNFKILIKFRVFLNTNLKIITSQKKTFESVMEELADMVKDNGALLSEMEKEIFYKILIGARIREGNRQEIESIYSKRNKGFMEDSDDKLKDNNIDHVHKELFNENLNKTLKENCESCIILTGELDILTRPIMKMIRLENPICDSILCEVRKPVRFIFVCMGPLDRDIRYDEHGRCFAVMMKNKKFRVQAFEATLGEQLVKASDTFFETSIVLPMIENASAEVLGGMVQQIRECKKNTQPKQIINIRDENEIFLMPPNDDNDSSKREYKKKFKHDFCPPCIQVFRSFKPYFSRYLSDFKDVFSKENGLTVFTSIFFIYFVCLGPAITLGAILNHPDLTVTAVIFGTGIFQIFFGLFAGQPLCIIGLTATTFIIETSIVSSAKANGITVSVLRFWVSIYGAMFGCLFLFFNLPTLVKHIRISLEEIFNSFIGFFFALKAIFTMFKLIKSFDPVIIVGNLTQPGFTVPGTDYSLQKKNGIAGVTLFLGFTMTLFCLTLASIKKSSYLRRSIRKILGSFNVPLGIILTVALERIFFRAYELPTLPIPASDQINTSLWVAPLNVTALSAVPPELVSKIHSTAVPIGLALAVLIFTESTLNGITALKTKAKKKGVLEMDFIILLVIFPIISGLVGWPFASGATVRTISHITALVIMEPKAAPGLQPKIMGTVEQRISNITVGVLVAFSVCLGTILMWIPLAALYGMFLYMGIMTLRDLTFVKRCVALLMRRKHWDEWDYIRGIPTRHILVFSLIEMFFVSILIILNIVSEFTTASEASLVFPLIIFIYGILREFILPKWPWMNQYLHHLDKKHKVGGAADIKPELPTTAQREPGPGTGLNLPVNLMQAGSNNEKFYKRLWEVNRSKAIDDDPSEFMNVEGYKRFLAQYAGKTVEEYSDEEDILQDTWAT